MAGSPHWLDQMHGLSLKLAPDGRMGVQGMTEPQLKEEVTTSTGNKRCGLEGDWVRLWLEGRREEQDWVKDRLKGFRAKGQEVRGNLLPGVWSILSSSDSF